MIPGSDSDGGWPYYREVRGGREDNWGIGFGFDFNDEEGPSPVADCPTTWCEGSLDGGASEAIPNGDSGCGSTPLADLEADSAIHCSTDHHYSLQPVLSDEHLHAGISFWARSQPATDTTLSQDADGGDANGGQDADSGVPLPTLTVLVSDVRTAYVGYNYIEAGACIPCAEAGSIGACGNDFATTVNLTPNWKQFVVRFSDLRQAPWSFEAGTYAGPPIDSTLLGHIIFELQTTRGDVLPPFFVQLAYVEWFDEFDVDASDE
jgi:hypothetical protein